MDAKIAYKMINARTETVAPTYRQPPPGPVTSWSGMETLADILPRLEEVALLLAEIAVILGAIAVMVLFYFLPTFIALKREHPARRSVFTVNFFFGWTTVGWIAAFIWACVDIPPSPPPNAGAT